MALNARFQKRVFQFGFDARTSRGAMRDRTSWFIRIGTDESPLFGMGEVAPLPGLSLEKIPQMEETLTNVVGRINLSKPDLPSLTGQPQDQLVKLNEWLKEYFSDDFLLGNPSILFALETALLDLANGGSRLIFENNFTKGQRIPINGLIWMGGLDFMLQQIEIKIRDGFRCLKIKVGGLDFDKDCDILQYIRRKYFRETIVVRLDANGAFKPEDAAYKLGRLSRYDVHSIEQPLKAGFAELPELCRQSPIPVALDEELIGVFKLADKEKLLDRIKPAYITLKPTLHGGLFGCQEWIDVARQRNIGWWITSALESNVGLNAISQYAANDKIEIPQGLGTGTIFTNNIPSPMRVDKGDLFYDISRETWDFSTFD